MQPESSVATKLFMRKSDFWATSSLGNDVYVTMCSRSTLRIITFGRVALDAHSNISATCSRHFPQGLEIAYLEVITLLTIQCQIRAHLHHIPPRHECCHQVFCGIASVSRYAFDQSLMRPFTFPYRGSCKQSKSLRITQMNLSCSSMFSNLRSQWKEILRGSKLASEL